MASSNYLFSILFIALVTLQPTLGFELLNNICLPTSSNFTSASQYTTNVKALLKTLTSRSTLASTGFSMGSTGQPDTQQAYGLINCRADVSASDCKACAHQSTKDALSLCPGSQGAVLWYDSCLLKCSDSDFLGTVDTENQFRMSSAVSVSGDPTRFGSRVKDLLNKLSQTAVTDPKLFALGKAKADSDTTVYGMVSCTRDLSSNECGSCLQEVVGDFSNCCDGVKGGRVIAASCMFRFELYPF